MLQQVIPVGPDANRALADVIDRRQVLDPAALWPGPVKCPDWPAVAAHQRYDGSRGKAAAEARLELLGQLLNRGSGKLRSPTEDERAEEFARLFRKTGSQWHHLGIPSLSPLGMLAENDATLIVEAAHIRGYLRKLEAIAERDAEADRRRKESIARRTLEKYRSISATSIAEIKAMAEAAERHRQRIEDEKAFYRSKELRRQLDAMHSEAVTAAHALGLGVPDFL